MLSGVLLQSPPCRFKIQLPWSKNLFFQNKFKKCLTKNHSNQQPYDNEKGGGGRGRKSHNQHPNKDENRCFASITRTGAYLVFTVAKKFSGLSGIFPVRLKIYIYIYKKKKKATKFAGQIIRMWISALTQPAIFTTSKKRAYPSLPITYRIRSFKLRSRQPTKTHVVLISTSLDTWHYQSLTN